MDEMARELSLRRHILGQYFGAKPPNLKPYDEYMVDILEQQARDHRRLIYILRASIETIDNDKPVYHWKVGYTKHLYNRHLYWQKWKGQPLEIGAVLKLSKHNDDLIYHTEKFIHGNLQAMCRQPYRNSSEWYYFDGAERNFFTWLVDAYSEPLSLSPIHIAYWNEDIMGYHVY